MTEHKPIMTTEVIEGLLTDTCACYLDGTLGGGGHSAALLEHLDSGASLIGLDRDPLAVARCKTRFAHDTRISIHQARFSELSKYVSSGSCQGILLDLGMSSDQLNDVNRGFSFQRGSSLDIRMDPAEGTDTWEVLAHTTLDDLITILRRWGELPAAHLAAQAILAEAKGSRDKTKLVGQLGLVAKQKRQTPAQYLAQVFQALRMWVNKEEEEIQKVLPLALAALKPGGRLAILTFHSLEDRWVKTYIREQEKSCICPPETWRCLCGGNHQKLKRIYKKALRPSDSEIAANPRSRSAKLRVAEKVA